LRCPRDLARFSCEYSTSFIAVYGSICVPFCIDAQPAKCVAANDEFLRRPSPTG
jgi:hypothetical protein